MSTIVDRLTGDRNRFTTLASAFNGSGEAGLKRKAAYAAQALAAAARAVTIYQEAVDASRTQEKTVD